MSTPSPMSYGRLRPTSAVLNADSKPVQSHTRRWWLLLIIGAVFLAAATSVLTVAILKTKNSSHRTSLTRPTKAITRACGRTLYPDLCVESLVGFPGGLNAGGEEELVPLSVNLTHKRLRQALSSSSEIQNWEMDSIGRSAYRDCIELLDESVDLLATSLLSLYPTSDVDGAGDIHKGESGGSTEDVMTWLSAALTNQDTCTAGLALTSGSVRTHMSDRLRDVSELVSNALALYTGVYTTGDGGGSDFAGVPINNRRLMSSPELGFPTWMSREAVELTTVIEGEGGGGEGGGGGGGGEKGEAIKMAPEKSSKRFIIHVKAGRYEESNLKVGRKKMNVWIIGDGKGKTVIAGSKSVAHDKITTFHTATFAANGAGFVAKDITFTNEAGPENNQAVALRVGADHATIYRCEIKGYQDTLYTHSQRQFYRDCDIYGTVDFIFGNAAVVFQNCNIWARKPMARQKVTITAQNRKDPNQNTGMSIHECQILATADLEPVKLTYPTFLGRPWKVYSRVVYMMSKIGDHVDPSGWLEWNSTSPVDKLYYGEYLNSGPQSGTSGRVKWPGIHVNMTKGEANRFTVAQFIYGSTWLTPTGVAFQAGLTA